MRSCAETLKTKILLLYTILAVCQPPPEMLKNRRKIGAKWEVRKGRGKNVEKLTLVGRNVLEKVPKGQPKGSKMESETEPKSSKIDPLASQMQQSFIFLSQEGLEVGTGSKNTENLYKIR